MARARNIKPGLFSNELLVELPAFDRLLFIGMWCLADREGRLEDRPKRIKLELFPCDTYDVGEGLERLSGAGFINRYEVEGVAVVEIVNFQKHQNPHGSEKDSVLPDKDGYLTVNARKKNVVIPGQQRKVHVKDAQNNVNPPLEPVNHTSSNALIPDSPNPDSLIPDSKDQKPLVASVEATGDQVEGVNSNDHSDGDQDELEAAGKAETYSQDFELFWSTYPKRHRSSPKAAAWRVWRARIRDGEDPRQMIAAAGLYAGEQRREGKTGSAFVKLPGTFLGPDQHWREYLGEQSPPNHPSPGAQGSAVLHVPVHSQEMYPDDFI